MELTLAEREPVVGDAGGTVRDIAMNHSGNQIRLAFYTASDGPRIVLFVPIGTDLTPLVTFFRNMTRATDPNRIDEQPFVSAFGGVEILATVADSKDCAKGLRQIDAEHPCFEWECTGDEWYRLSELVVGVNQTNAPCHQYLTQSRHDDAIVLVSKGEYSDEVLRD